MECVFYFEIAFQFQCYKSKVQKKMYTLIILGLWVVNFLLAQPLKNQDEASTSSNVSILFLNKINK